MSDPVQVYFTIPRVGDPNDSPMVGNCYTGEPLAHALSQARGFIDAMGKNVVPWHLMGIPEILLQSSHDPNKVLIPAQTRPPVGYAELMVGTDTNGRFTQVGKPVAIVSHAYGAFGSAGPYDSLQRWFASEGYQFLSKSLLDGDRLFEGRPVRTMSLSEHPSVGSAELQGLSGFKPYAVVAPVEDPERALPYGKIRIKDLARNPLVSALLGPQDIVSKYNTQYAPGVFFCVGRNSMGLEASIDIQYDELLRPGKVYAVLYEEQSPSGQDSIIGKLRIMGAYDGKGSVTVVPGYEYKSPNTGKQKTRVLGTFSDLWGGFTESIAQRLGAALGYFLKPRVSVAQVPVTNSDQTSPDQTDQGIWHVPAGSGDDFRASPIAPQRSVAVNIHAAESSPLENLVKEITTRSCGGCHDLLSAQARDSLVIGKDELFYHSPCFEEVVVSPRRAIPPSRTELGVNYEVISVALDVLVQGKAEFRSRAELLAALQALPETLQRYGLRAEFERRISQVPRNTSNLGQKPTVKIIIPKKPGDQ